jgi:iron complex transport system ATP-binding protein
MTLSVNGVQFGYDGREVLREIGFHLKKGQILGVFGVNGAGKSTLLKLLNRVLKPHRGTVFVDEKDVASLRRIELARIMGYVPQKYTEEALTVFDAVLLGRRPHIEWGPTARDFAVVEAVFKTMRLEGCALRRVTELSGGEVQKVVIARALAQEPDVLLLDEPTSSLDMKNQIEVMTLVKEVTAERGVAVVISLHDLNLALRFADLFLMLKNGLVHCFTDRASLTPDIIGYVYGVEVILAEVHGFPVVIPLARSNGDKGDRQ